MAMNKNKEELKKMLDAADKAVKFATAASTPLVYYLHPTKPAFVVEEDNKEYIVTYDWLEVNKMSLIQFWGKASQEVKNKILSTKPIIEVNSLMEALKNAAPVVAQPKLQFTSLQEMYDTAKPHKKKKGAAKTVGAPAVAQQYYTTNGQIHKLLTDLNKPSPLLEYLSGPPNSPGAPEQLDPPTEK